MLSELLAITPMHIVLLAACAFLVVLLILLGIIFSGKKKRRNQENEENDAASASVSRSEVSADCIQKKEDVSESAEPSAENAAVSELQQPVREIVASSAAEGASPVAEEEPVVQEENSDQEELPAVQEAPAEKQPRTPAAECAAEMTAEAEAPAQTQAEIIAEQPNLIADKPARVVYATEDGWYVRIRYDKSFEAKLIQSGDTLKKWYSELKNELLSYRKVTARSSWQHEAFRLGRGTVAKLVIRGKTLRLYLALDPATYEGSKYLVEDASEHAKFEKTPLLYRIRSERRCRYAKELIAAAVAAAGGQYGEERSEDYASVPFEDTQTLIGRGLVRIVEVRRRTDGAGGTELPEEDDIEDEEIPADEEETSPVPESEREPESEPEPEPELLPDPAAEHRVSVTVAEKLMTDDEAFLLPAEKSSDGYRQTIVNIDTLGEYFLDGEHVSIEEMRERIPFFDKKATAVKVLARGVLNKTLEVEADDFSLAAVKMILLLGGKAYVRGK